ncbi:hypothetical protein [Lysobacter solisilvae (ex Woo and Kim 2020)]|uniref:Uncharacterized protein n=1 Tax=Agrilutibacter terrestris TaxID=2865112 RepID=A0A7H0G016_9GAMM|nr:hypothetical protein [Lysobacter terrestris]QNP41632.1 hypothetical protein H8B22_05340 [Lysobacter terrestris]
MNTKSPQPPSPAAFAPQWTSQELADAVPRPLSELITPALVQFAAAREAANGVALSPWAFDWRRRDDLPAFRVR